MGYSAGLLKYWVKGPFTNPVAFYIYGAGLLALLNAALYLVEGEFVQMTLEYFVTKYLPPTSVGQMVWQVLIGTFVAGVKWFVLTPRR